MPRTTPISRRDFVLGTLIAVAMAGVFAMASFGRSLLVTFVPGVAMTWALYVYLFVRERELPAAGVFMPWYLAAFSWQFLHFTEEFATGFQDRFPVIYDGEPLTDIAFIAGNMAAYTLFLLSAVGVFFVRLSFLFVPALFFIVYGALGNAFTHSFWVVASQAYFPGFFTSLAYWVIGPLVLSRLGLNHRELVGFAAVWAAVLLACAGGFVDIDALRESAAG